MTDNLLKEIANKTETEFQIILSRKYAWEYCCFIDPEFFNKRKKALQPIVDAYQYVVQSSMEPENIPKKLVERLKSNPYVKKFREDPHNVACSLPPRSGKSYSMSVCNSWGLGKFPVESQLRVSHSQRLYNKFSRYVRSIISGPKFSQVFPGIELSKNNTEIACWSLVQSKQYAFYGSGVGGGITGDGASLLAITDDLYKSHQDAMSIAVNESTLEFMDSVFDARMEKNCRQFDLGTRWAKKDYIGVKTDGDEYDIVIRIPALDDEGETFCKDVKSTEQYQTKKDRLIRNGRDYLWHSEYQQEPIDIKGILFPKSVLKRFSKKDLNMQNCVGKICFVDTADKGTDFYSAPVGYIFPNDGGYDVYVARVIFTRDEFKYTQPLQVEMINSEEITYTFIETNKEGSLYVNNIKKECPGFKIKGLISKGQKETRILVEVGYVLDFYYLVDEEQDPMYEAYIENLTTYRKEGGNKNDDAPDSTSALSKAIRSIFKYLKKETQDESTNGEQET